MPEGTDKPKKLLLKKTKTAKISKIESSRIKNQDITQLSAKPKLILKPPAKKEVQAIPEIIDPMAIRNTDTSRLRKLTLNKKDVNSDDDFVSRDTVHLKVIKEKKKQLAGILTASQTIRLRPSSEGSDSKTPSIADPAPSQASLKLKSTAPQLKPKASSTLKLSPNLPLSSQKTQDLASDTRTKKLTLKLNPTGGLKNPKTSMEAQKLKPNLPVQPSEKSEQITQASLADTGTTQVKSLKLKPKTQEAPTVRLPAESPDQTVDLGPNTDETVTEKKGLKLKKTKTRPAMTPPSKSLGTVTTIKDKNLVANEDSDAEEPGIIMTAISVAAILVLSITTFFIVSNYCQLMQL